MSELLADANVLVDYCASEDARSVLKLIAARLGPLHVASPVLVEVRQLNRQQCAALGLTVFDPTFDQVVQARKGPWQLSFEDALCVLLAQANGWTCLTNDRRILTVCGELGIETWRGLRPMTELVRIGLLSPERAWAAAQDIRSSNPLHITKSILQRFRRQIGLSA